MNRRKFIKILSIAGAATVLVNLRYWKTPVPRNSYYLITADPDRDLPRLLQIIGLEKRKSLSITKTAVPPTQQDLTLIANGGLVDPGNARMVARVISEFTADLRSRALKGTVLVTVEPEPVGRDKLVVFEYNGEVVERVHLHKNYQQIEIPGAVGKTLFRLQDGRLSVIKSSCRHRLCEKMGARTSGRIICAPNRLVATLNGPTQLVYALTG